MGETDKYRAGLIERGIEFSSLSFGTDTHTISKIEINGIRCHIDFYECKTSFGWSTSLRVTPYGETDASTALKLVEAMQEPFDGVCQ